uniref:Macaca fascicularis brain cDNA, clone: QorA-13786 n=1 Tax=Macaca fascicularis TaxID=9541 RepID=I7GHM1_MACFA|nr:unnamed protein product [Macaca fascicularis]
MAHSACTHRGGSSTERALKCCAPPRTHNSRIANRRLEREAAEASSDRGPGPPGSDFLSRGCAAGLQVGVKMQKRSLGLSHGRSLLTVPRACLQTTEPRTPRPPHRPGPECAGPDLQPPRILTPLHRSACVGGPQPAPSKQEPRRARAPRLPPPSALRPWLAVPPAAAGPGIRAAEGAAPTQGSRHECGRWEGLRPFQSWFPAVSWCCPRSRSLGQTSPCPGACQCPQPAGLGARMLADGQALTTLSSLGACW